MSWRHYLALILLLIFGFTAVAAYKVYKGKYLKTETFIAAYMTNPNGTLATYLADNPGTSPDMAHGREALSEALGLWLLYAVEKDDKDLFEKHYTVLKQYFVTPQGFVYWKLTPAGIAEVSTNALVDDLRIVDSLLAADRKWGNAEWKETALTIGRFLASHLVKNGMLVDFFDQKFNNSPDTLTLSYLDLPSLDRLGTAGILPASVLQQAYLVIGQSPSDGVFYPKSYDVRTRQYQYDSTVNLIDQLLVALQLRHSGMPSSNLIAFLKQEFAQKGMINGTYDRQFRLAKGAFESPAVYALLIIYCIETGDRQFAVSLYERMAAFRQTSGTYQGGYVSGSNTHIFDNLYPQIAELKMYHAYPFYFVFH